MPDTRITLKDKCQYNTQQEDWATPGALSLANILITTPEINIPAEI